MQNIALLYFCASYLGTEKWYDCDKYNKVFDSVCRISRHLLKYTYRSQRDFADQSSDYKIERGFQWPSSNSCRNVHLCQVCFKQRQPNGQKMHFSTRITAWTLKSSFYFVVGRLVCMSILRFLHVFQPVSRNPANGIQPGSNCKMTDKRAAECWKAELLLAYKSVYNVWSSLTTSLPEMSVFYKKSVFEVLQVNLFTSFTIHTCMRP